jgi:hypothetical protein
VYGVLLFADGHAGAFEDRNRDGTFGWAEGDGFLVSDEYPEIENVVFGGHLSSGRFAEPSAIR